MLDIVCTGDLVLDEPNPDYWLSGIATALHSASLAIGHLEVPHTRLHSAEAVDVPAPGAAPEHLLALRQAGIDAVSLAGNHIADCGAAGIADTVQELDRLGIRHAGAGANLAAARQPALLDCGTFRTALLSYNCVGPEQGWAQADRPGSAFIRVSTADGSAITPTAPLRDVDPASLRQLEQDIQGARRAGATVCLVALHKGIVHTPAQLAPYERAVAHGAIEAGADAVISHHAHILRGIEFHRGRPIFHGLGNGCVVTRALSPDNAHPKRAEWARQRRERFGFEPDPAYYLAPFHPEAVHGMLARLRIVNGHIAEAGFIPLWVEAPGRPVLARGERAQAVRDYVAHITQRAGLPALRLADDGAMISVRAEG